ncbi:Uncharacterised protein [Mycobacteroides abscessus subsp. massiliense]|nr:Uncharacterised protein [Mycobacteroides abscessus subsp. massiliense]
MIAPLPWAANSGQYRATGALYSSSPRSTSLWMMVAVTPLDAEKITGAVSRVQACPFCA